MRPGRDVRRRALAVGRRLYALALLGVLGWVLVTAREQAGALFSGARPGVLVAALAASFGQLALTSAFWASGLRALGSPVGYRASLDATLGSTPARYLPGSVWYAVGRAARLRGGGAAGAALATVAGLETLLVPVVGFAFGGALLAGFAGGRAGPRLDVRLLAAVVALAALGSPPVVNAGLALLARRRGGTPARLRWRTHLRLAGWTVAFWAWAGGVFALYLSAFPAVQAGAAPRVAGAYMVAWGIGWLAFFAPQGAGVSEAAVAALLAGRASASVALVVAGYRVVVAVRDVLGYLAVLLARRRAAASSSRSSATSLPCSRSRSRSRTADTSAAAASARSSGADSSASPSGDHGSS